MKRVITALVALSFVAAACGSNKKKSGKSNKGQQNPNFPLNPNTGNPNGGTLPGGGTPDGPGSIGGLWINSGSSGSSSPEVQLNFSSNGQFSLNRYYSGSSNAFESRQGSYTVTVLGDALAVDLVEIKDGKVSQGQQPGQSVTVTTLCRAQVVAGQSSVVTRELLLNCNWTGGARPASFDTFTERFVSGQSTF